MALTAQTSGASNWGRWAQQQLPGDYTMAALSVMFPFDSQTSNTVLIQRPTMSRCTVQDSSSAGLENSLTMPYHQVHNPYQFSPYQGPAPPHHPIPFKEVYSGHSPKRHENDHGRVPPHPSTPYVEVEQAHSPARVDAEASTVQCNDCNPPFASKTIISNETLHGDKVANFDTEVDELMKAIQRNAEMHLDVAQQPLTQRILPSSLVSSESHGIASPSVNKASGKRYRCDGPNCQKSFTQKSHLDSHRRTHSGEKPYPCDITGCEDTFSQLSNLKTHRRRHTGERPFSCDKCDRRFAQGGNLRAHLQTHQGLKPFVCILDGCNKTFSQLGNMKIHQNRFHKKTLSGLTMRFAQILNSGETVPGADLKLFEYFATHYKNSNKGIKGRGKVRKVVDRKLKPLHSPIVKRNTSIPQSPLPRIAFSSPDS